jgi:hypothetical protein
LRIFSYVWRCSIWRSFWFECEALVSIWKWFIYSLVTMRKKLKKDIKKIVSDRFPLSKIEQNDNLHLFDSMKVVRFPL